MLIQLFYSNKCSACVELLAVIINEGIQRIFVPVCLDDMNSSELVIFLSKLRIEKIPAIIITEGNLQPTVLEGALQCSQWLNTMIQNRRNNIKQIVENQRRAIQKTQTALRMKNESALEYVPDEMDGVSDSYAYTTTDMYQPKNYVPHGCENGYLVVTPQVMETKINKDELTRQMSSLEQTREADKMELQKIMEQNQIAAIMHAQTV